MGYDAQNCPSRLKSVLKTLGNDKDILDSNRATILKFRDWCFAEGLSTGRIIRCIYILRTLAKYYGKDFYTANKDDIINIVGKIEADDYAYTTKCEMKVTLKKFYSWLRQCEAGEHPVEVKWIKIKRKRSERLSEQMLTEDDIKKLIDVCNTSRDRALIAVLYESGCRAGELLGMKLKDVSKDQYGFKIVVDGKTGMRKVRLLSSAPYLIEWLNEHPKKETLDSHLWVSQRGRGNYLEYVGFLQFCRRIRLRAGITKACNPHAFRHSRATYLAGHLSDALLKEYMGWTMSSRMTEVYVHLNGKQLDDELFKLNGIKTKEEVIDKMSPKVCFCCSFENQATNTFCARCGTVLDRVQMIENVEIESERKKMDNVMDKLLEDEKFKELFLHAIKKINVK